MIRRSLKEQLHPRNRFRGGYDFQQLIKSSPALKAFVAPNAYGDDSIDYADPNAVKALNQALLKFAYGLKNWDIPPGYLCPPVPGRSDYIHHVADLLRDDGGTTIPRGKTLRVLDIGVGANCIYPLIGASEYGWSFVASDIDPAALKWARTVVSANPSVARLIECRLQPAATECFKGVIKPGESFAVSICNPPFFASAKEAITTNRRKQQHLKGRSTTVSAPNFGGKAAELWCPGGELAFVRRLIVQSAELPRLCRWFTSLISKSDHLPHLQTSLEEVKTVETKVIEMAQGQKKSRILAWTFMDAVERTADASRR